MGVVTTTTTNEITSDGLVIPNSGTNIVDSGDGTDSTSSYETIPNEIELLLLCLDHLREVRRSYPRDTLLSLEGINPHYITLACWALNHAIVAPNYLRSSIGNDPWFDPTKQQVPANTNTNTTTQYSISPLIEPLPDLQTMEREILYMENPNIPLNDPSNNVGNSSSNLANWEKETKEGDYGDTGAHNNPNNITNNEIDWYEYNDMHRSNGIRFYPLAGLASGPTIRGSLTLGEITAAGLTGLGARTRIAAENDMIQSTLFEQFVEAVHAKGFFDGTTSPTSVTGTTSTTKNNTTDENDGNGNAATVLYEERYRKVVAKFRTKLATKADALTTGDFIAFSAADQHRKRRTARIQQAYQLLAGTNNPMDTNTTTNPRLLYDTSNSLSKYNTTTTSMDPNNNNKSLMVQYNPLDIDEAEKLKNLGNTAMQRKDYKMAVEYYTQALKLVPNGPNAHVYFSNRAAALVSMKKFHEAVLDSERSLALKPDYGKAHARLGLAHFLLGNYRQAIEAYTVALKYEPNNQSSKNYLEKSAKRLAEMGDIPNKTSLTTSYSVVSEWDQNHPNNKQQQQQQSHSRRPSQNHIPTSGAKPFTTEGNDDTTTNAAVPLTSKTEITVTTTSADTQPLLVNHEREAEKYKVKGNSLMASREYIQAYEAYSRAIEVCSDGLQSHVYYSNRAAALCYLERYEEAEKDSLRSLQLNPTYGKAHARLGLSRFFLQDYSGAVQAYTKALEYDPENSASKSYLAKALSRLEQASGSNRSGAKTPSGSKTPSRKSSSASGGINRSNTSTTPSNKQSNNKDSFLLSPKTGGMMD